MSQQQRDWGAWETLAAAEAVAAGGWTRGAGGDATIGYFIIVRLYWLPPQQEAGTLTFVGCISARYIAARQVQFFTRPANQRRQKGQQGILEVYYNLPVKYYRATV